MSSVIRDSNGFEHLTETYFPKRGGATIDLFGTLSAATPFHALVLKPTTASFATDSEEPSMLVFMDTEQERFIAVLFTSGSLVNTQIGMILQLLGIAIPDDSQGMWVLSLSLSEEGLFNDPNASQLFQITDGTNILIPEVNLAELTGIESADMFSVLEDESGLFQGSFEEENMNITSIAGCEICFRFTLAQALQYLLDQKTGRLAIAESELSTSSKSELLSTLHSGGNPLTLLVNTIGNATDGNATEVKK